jgi:hypothetical protein
VFLIVIWFIVVVGVEHVIFFPVVFFTIKSLVDKVSQVVDSLSFGFDGLEQQVCILVAGLFDLAFMLLFFESRLGLLWARLLFEEIAGLHTDET